MPISCHFRYYKAAVLEYVTHLSRATASVLTFNLFLLISCVYCMTGKVVPEEAVLEMKLNYSLPSESDPHVDEIVWVEQPRDKSEVLVQM